MGLSAQLVDGRLICIGHDELGREIRSDQSALLILGNDLDRFLSPILDALRLKRSTTIRGSFPKLKSLGEALTHLGVTRLRQAQLSLLAQSRYAHPFYWAPFILMGNWK